MHVVLTGVFGPQALNSRASTTHLVQLLANTHITTACKVVPCCVSLWLFLKAYNDLIPCRRAA